MSEEEKLYERLLAQGYTKREIHGAMYRFMLLEIQHRKATDHPYTSVDKNRSLCSKTTHFLKSLVSTMVSLIKTQFAKKPKNPI